MSKQIYIRAYTKINLGDDLFIKILCDRYKEHKFYIYASKEYKKILSNVENLKVYSLGYKIVEYIGKVLHKLGNKNFVKIIIQNKIVKKCDAIVTIGGSMFIQKGLTFKRTKIKLKYDEQLLSYNKPLFLIGSNFGPYVDENYYEQYKKIFEKYKDVCFREEYSYNLFKDLKNVRFAKDVIFNYKPKKSNKEKTKTVVFSIIDFERKDQLKESKDKYENKMIELINLYTEKGYNVKLVGFCNAEGDKRAIERIYENENILNKQKIEKYYYNGNIEECIQKINEAEIVIATRFHSMILGYVLDKKVFTFSYSKKTTNVLKDLNLEHDCVEVENIKNADVNWIYNKLRKEKQVVNLQEVVKDAELQFKELERYIGESNEQI